MLEKLFFEDPDIPIYQTRLIRVGLFPTVILI